MALMIDIRPVQSIPFEVARDAVMIAAARLDDRRERRRHRRSQYRAPPRCPACHKFKSGYGGQCKSCGFTEGVGYPL